MNVWPVRSTQKLGLKSKYIALLGVARGCEMRMVMVYNSAKFDSNPVDMMQTYRVLPLKNWIMHDL